MPLLKCDSCKANDESIRRVMGCGWLPPLEDANVWSGPKGHLELATCPGYTTELPDVVDIAHLYWWADKGGLQRDSLPPVLVQGIDVLRGAAAESEAYAMEKMRERK